MSSDLRENCLCDLVNHKKGFAFKSKDYLEDGVPVIRVSNFTDDSISDEDLKFVSKDVAHANKEVALQEFDIVVATVGSWPNNPASVVGRTISVPTWATSALMNQNSVILRAKSKSLIDQRFIYYQMKSVDFSNHVVSKAQGSANQASITLDAIFSYPIYWPSLDRREAIVSFLSSLDDRITLLRKSNATLESIAQALFKSWFVDFDPVRAKMAGRVPEGMDEATAALFPDSFEEFELGLGLVPKGWTIKSVGDLLAPKRGKTITKSKCVSGDIPVVAGGLEPAYFHNMANVSAPVVTVSASGANAGFVRLYQQDIWASDCSFVSSNQTDDIYFWYVFMKANQEKIYFMQQGAAQPHIYPSDLMRLIICSSKLGEERGFFNNVVSPLFEKIGLANQKIRTLSNLRDTLLPRLMSGQLRLPV